MANNENRGLLEYEENDDDPEMEAPIVENEFAEEHVAQAERISVPTVTYDITLPAAHSYLGNDLEDLSGRTVHEEAASVELPVIILPNVVLFPGQILPLHIMDPPRVRMLRYVMNKDNTFGILPKLLNRAVGRVGTTAEISSYKEENLAGVDTIVVKAQGRQRFTLLDTRNTVEGLKMGRVRILSETRVEDPLRSVHGRMCRMFHYRPRTRLVSLDYQDKKFCLVTRPTAPLYDACLCRRRMTQWPPWVYKQYDETSLTNAILEELRKSWDETLLSGRLTHLDFSYWLAANLPWMDVTKVLLLAMDSPIQRLRLQLRLIRKCTVLVCARCQLKIADKRDILSLSCTGPMAAYVNPQGYVHETITLHSVMPRTLVLRGGPETENSWFPGYAWTILECARCSYHMGWKFTAVKAGLEPKAFWGLCRPSIAPTLAQPDIEDGACESGEVEDELGLQLRLLQPYLSHPSTA